MDNFWVIVSYGFVCAAVGAFFGTWFTREPTEQELRNRLEAADALRRAKEYDEWLWAENNYRGMEKNNGDR